MQRATRRQVVQGVGVVGLGLVAGCARPFTLPRPAATARRVALLSGTASATFIQAAFRQGLRDLGYAEGENLILDERYADGDDRVAEPAAELLGLHPEAIVVPSVVVARTVATQTTTIPIVSAGGGDLVVAGLAVSHARPGGNVTGVTIPELGAKRLQLLLEAVPALSRLVYLFDTTNPPREQRQNVESAAAALGVQVQFLGVGSAPDLPVIFETGVGEHANGLFVAQGPAITDNLARIVELALRSRLPSMWAQSDAVGPGGLMAYGPNRADMARRAAGYVDKILKGAKPADLPVEQPREFDFVINLKTAQALGLTIPPHVLLQATEVIQ